MDGILDPVNRKISGPSSKNFGTDRLSSHFYPVSGTNLRGLTPLDDFSQSAFPLWQRPCLVTFLAHSCFCAPMVVSLRQDSPDKTPLIYLIRSIVLSCQKRTCDPNRLRCFLPHQFPNFRLSIVMQNRLTGEVVCNRVWTVESRQIVGEIVNMRRKRIARVVHVALVVAASAVIGESATAQGQNVRVVGQIGGACDVMRSSSD